MPQSEKVRILVVGPSPPSIGGVETFVQILLNSRLADKYRLIHIDTTRKRSRPKNLNQVTLTSLYYLARQLAAVLVACIRQRPHIIHLPVTSGISFWKGATFILAGRLFGLKVVAHLHGGYFHEYFTEQNHHIQVAIRWVLSQASVVIALSENWRRFVQEEIRPSVPVWIVPNTVEEVFVDSMHRSKKPLTGGRKTVFFLGRLHESKGVFDILKAISLVLQERSDLRFVIAGPEQYAGIAAQMKEVCEQEGLGPYVQIPGPVMGQDKLDLFFSSSVFVLPSYVENFPYTVLEAMASGLPVITTPVGALPEVVEEGVNGFFITPGDYRALAERITLLARDERLREEMAEANRAKILERFIPETAIAELEKVYDELLASSPIDEQHHRLTDGQPNRRGGLLGNE
jgi:glycosyltransferase involved in cell wall biosynthesis